MTKLLRSSKQLDTFPSCQETPEFSGVSFFALEQNKSFRRAYLLDLPSFFQKIMGGETPVTLHKKTNKTFVAECRFGAAARQCAKAEPLTVSMLRCKTFVAGCRFGAAARQCASAHICAGVNCNPFCWYCRKLPTGNFSGSVCSIR